MQLPPETSTQRIVANPESTREGKYADRKKNKVKIIETIFHRKTQKKK